MIQWNEVGRGGRGLKCIYDAGFDRLKLRIRNQTFISIALAFSRRVTVSSAPPVEDEAAPAPAPEVPN